MLWRGLVLGLAAWLAGAESSSAWPSRMEVQARPAGLYEAMRLLQGRGTSERFDPLMCAEVAAALAGIRAEFPQVAGIRARGRYSLTTLMLSLKDGHPPLADGLEGMPHERKAAIRECGIASIDAVARSLRVVDMSSIGGFLLCLTLPEPLDTERVARRFAGLAEVESAMPDALMGDGDDIIFLPRADAWLFVFKRGKGDCPAGCTERHYWYFRHDRKARKSVFVDELHPEGKGPASRFARPGFNLWGVPGYRGVHRAAFGSIDDVIARLGDADWWVALHATEVLGFLMTSKERSHSPTDDPQLVAALRDHLATDRRRAVQAALGALDHADAEVAETTLAWLRKYSGLALGRTPAERGAWRAWAATSGR